MFIKLDSAKSDSTTHQCRVAIFTGNELYECSSNLFIWNIGQGSSLIICAGILTGYTDTLHKMLSQISGIFLVLSDSVFPSLYSQLCLKNYSTFGSELTVLVDLLLFVGRFICFFLKFQDMSWTGGLMYLQYLEYSL